MTWPTRDFSAACWQHIAPIRQRIDRLPLLVELADGTLEARRFVEYIVQDDFYLRGYSRALAQLAARAPQARARAFWARSAGEAVEAEVLMHDALLNDPLLKDVPHASTPSPTTRGYVNFIQTAVAYEPYPVGVAAVLPCYWVYAQVGLDLAERAATVQEHPYGTWVAAYADPAFQQATATAIDLLDEAAESADEATRTQMLSVFADATRYEELFWERSHHLEAWTL
ncbi:TenA family transcriptional regulator [Arachnia propionica]|uniref:TenA family transcriptional regulator n=1 Tax=Arachnia propionica TaxID=1750 RepID=A0A3P1T5B8_9ACTN|nr:TenA family protein [Arachnia propionica]MDO5082432.1 TenA family protein [Arachnia propionica]RRD03996.1 TenA family transcriptional regulator [Arachnia propionica]